MEHIKLKAKKRVVAGNQVKKLRRVGIIPAVVYGNSVTPLNLEIDFKEFYHAYKAAGRTHVVDLSIDDNVSIPCIVHDIDVHPVIGSPRHIDFLAVNLKKNVQTEVPVEIVGEAPAVKEYGAVLNVIFQELEVQALPDNIPSSIKVDVSKLTDMNSFVTLGDLVTDGDKFTFILSLETEVVGLIQQSVEQPEVEPISEVVDPKATEPKTNE